MPVLVCNSTSWRYMYLYFHLYPHWGTSTWTSTSLTYYRFYRGTCTHTFTSTPWGTCTLYNVLEPVPTRGTCVQCTCKFTSPPLSQNKSLTLATATFSFPIFVCEANVALPPHQSLIHRRSRRGFIAITQSCSAKTKTRTYHKFKIGRDLKFAINSGIALHW